MAAKDSGNPLELPANLKTGSPEETDRAAAALADLLRPGDTVALRGDLGSGKTRFVKAACKQLGTLQEATSPSFTLINQYEDMRGGQIIHFDFYRLQHKSELINLGLDDYFDGENICFVEWSERVEEELPLPRYDVELWFVEGSPQSRRILIQQRVPG